MTLLDLPTTPFHCRSVPIQNVRWSSVCSQRSGQILSMGQSLYQALVVGYSLSLTRLSQTCGCLSRGAISSRTLSGFATLKRRADIWLTTNSIRNCRDSSPPSPSHSALARRAALSPDSTSPMPLSTSKGDILSSRMPRDISL